MTKKLTATAAMMLLLASVCAPAQSTQKFTASKANEFGLVYTLPATAFDVVVETEIEVSEPGEFYNYANHHLAIKDAVRQESRRVGLRSVTIVPRGVPNPDSRWSVQFKNGSNVTMFLTDGGLPLSINAPAIEEGSKQKLPVAKPMQESPLHSEAARQAVTQEMTRSTSIAKKAELAAQRIFELREQRNELISGNVENMPADGAALKVALAALDAQEEALTAMFAGVHLKETKVQTFTFLPGKDEVTDSLIARISPIDGLTDADDLSGLPLTVSLTIDTRGELPVTEKGEPKKFPKGGVAYNIPGTGTLHVYYDGTEVATQAVALPQAGCVFGIDPGLFSDKKAPMCARFSPVTGAMLSLEPATKE